MYKKGFFLLKNISTEHASRKDWPIKIKVAQRATVTFKKEQDQEERLWW